MEYLQECEQNVHCEGKISRAVQGQQYKLRCPKRDGLRPLIRSKIRILNGDASEKTFLCFHICLPERICHLMVLC